MLEDCLYHSDRYQFAEVEKELRRSKWIPRSHLHRLAMAVCSCRKSFAWDAADADLIVLQKHISQITGILDEDQETGRNTISQKLRMFLINIMDTAAVVMDKSSCRLLDILCRAEIGDYSYLTRTAISNNEPDDSKEQAERRRKKRLTAEQIKLIIRKKKKRMKSTVLKLPMFPGNTRRLEVTLGGKLDNFAQQNKCFLQYEKTMNDTSFQANTNETFIRIWSSNPVAFKDTRATLIETARAVQQKVHLEKQQRKEMKAQRKLMYLQMEDDGPIDATESCVKDMMSDDYAKKSWCKSTGRSRKGERKSQQSVLEGGHCLNCLTPFGSLKETAACKYHPGYIYTVSSRAAPVLWSCCNSEAADSVPLTSDHEQAGCSTVVTHRWRVHKKANRKPYAFRDETS